MCRYHKQLLRRFHMTEYEDAFIKSGYGGDTVAWLYL
jgi:hypothetical protein